MFYFLVTHSLKIIDVNMCNKHYHQHYVNPMAQNHETGKGPQHLQGTIFSFTESLNKAAQFKNLAVFLR
jgi:hypothetical protein